METSNDVTRMSVVGGNLALDFVNTRTGAPGGPADDDLLGRYDDLLSWSAHVGALTASEVARLRRLAASDEGGAAAALADGLRLRDDLDELFRGVAAGRRIPRAALDRLRDDEARALAHASAELTPTLIWTWSADRTIGRPVWPIVRAAVDLLATADPARIKQCGGCGFLFLDTTKNRSRRWCSMDDCGTAAKIERYVSARRERSRANG